ncbi:MAG: class I SAM-dependent methyltransferase [Reyranella sp.]|uniref:class I SAM-dependent methyltransferase n=1 Tax=Reyranella sp. TaxID=1929291 RepID=UPI0027311EE0|nr:class I SAM-dependent methyltransferase [Reyranella sp.]MDP1964382.1 class I SAM-dependent methyltransferase [Reyranella sp.]MDP2374892.1 class I SAM-dependent methyltransferase [Reyranella sp.]
MVDRTDGYVTDVGYTHGYYPELNPVRIRLALLNAGVAVPEIATACELGFGQGLSINIHAAASNTHWYGTDFIAEHAAFARQLAAASGSDIDLYEDSFEDFASRTDLPPFDHIGLHGVWSWVSDRNRTVIVDFIRRKLKPGGVLYIGYNALPGRAAFAPVRHLLAEHVNRGEAGSRGIVERIDDAIAFSDRLLATDPEYVRDHPLILDRFKVLRESDRHYLAHEFFNRDWVPMHFATLAQWLEPAMVSYICSTDFTDHIDALKLTEAQRTLLGEIGDPVFRQTARDFILNQSFRQDYWIRNARKLSDPERTEALHRTRVIATTDRPDLPFKLRAALALNKAGPGMAAYDPILELLADRKVRSLGEIEQAVGHKGLSLTQIVEAVTLIAGCHHVAVAQDEAATARARPHTDKFNAYAIASAHAGDDIDQLASPVTGGGIRVKRSHQLFLSALRQGRTEPDDWARQAAKVLAAESDAARLGEQARAFAADTLPTLRALQVV